MINSRRWGRRQNKSLRDDLILSLSPQRQVGGCSRQTGMKTMRQISISKDIDMVGFGKYKVCVNVGERRWEGAVDGK